VAVVATLSKGYDLDYIWTHVDRGPAKDAASYYLKASETGGEPPGRWWGPGAKALGFGQGRRIERQNDRKVGGLDLCKAAVQRPILAISRLSRPDSLTYDLLFGKRQAPTAPRWAGRPLAAARPRRYIKALLAAERHATAECMRRLVAAGLLPERAGQPARTPPRPPASPARPARAPARPGRRSSGPSSAKPSIS
jgi:hypothetical protein